MENLVYGTIFDASRSANPRTFFQNTSRLAVVETDEDYLAPVLPRRHAHRAWQVVPCPDPLCVIGATGKTGAPQGAVGSPATCTATWPATCTATWPATCTATWPATCTATWNPTPSAPLREAASAEGRPSVEGQIKLENGGRKKTRLMVYNQPAPDCRTNTS